MHILFYKVEVMALETMPWGFGTVGSFVMDIVPTHIIVKLVVIKYFGVRVRGA